MKEHQKKSVTIIKSGEISIEISNAIISLFIESNRWHTNENNGLCGSPVHIYDVDACLQCHSDIFQMNEGENAAAEWCGKKDTNPHTLTGIANTSSSSTKLNK